MRSYDYDFLIDGQPVLVPDADMQINMEDMESEESGRDESGVLHRILLRERVKSWSLGYGTLTKEEYLYMQSLLEGKTSFLVQVREPSGQVGCYQAYCSTVGITVYNRRLGIYRNYKLDIMEC